MTAAGMAGVNAPGGVAAGGSDKSGAETAAVLDFKMITFSLAGKDYGVDIMNVKEIARADKFTFVPNAASFVRGVYNLRGDIIPIIDLRSFFHLQMTSPEGAAAEAVDHRAEGLENMLILRVDDRVYGTIVDKIDKVVEIPREHIQPPHPIFGDINIKYIRGVVEKEGSLYVILDVIRIFSPDKGEAPGVTAPAPAPGGEGEKLPGAAPAPGPAPGAGTAAARSVDPDPGTAGAEEALRESLTALRRFYPSAVNESWLGRRLAEWSRFRADLRLQSEADADDFLAPFASPDTGRFWNPAYAQAVQAALPDLPSNNVQVWNIGCGRGYETFSFACILRARYPQGHIKIWANDSDIMAVSQGPNMLFELEDTPEYCRPFLNRGKNGYSFNQAIRDSIVFEYHDILNETPLPELDIILARDVLSFLRPEDQTRLIGSFAEKLKKRGVVFLGTNEVLPGGAWRLVAGEPLAVFAPAGTVRDEERKK